MRAVRSRTDSHACGVSRVSPRVRNTRSVLCRYAQPDLTIAEAQAPSVSGCPLSALKSKFANLKLSKEKQEEHDRAPQAPGPPALSLESALDVSQILRFGIHEAMLRFNNKYGDVCRFANPARCVLWCAVYSSRSIFVKIRIGCSLLQDRISWLIVKSVIKRFR